ncbi:MAG: hypothetical protein MAG458_00193 [Nitrosopumilus sp.]|nr:hypothetical protein [Nitrosopumilus sp.]
MKATVSTIVKSARYTPESSMMFVGSSIVLTSISKLYKPPETNNGPVITIGFDSVPCQAPSNESCSP